MAVEELQWLPTDLFLLKERLSPLAKLCKGSSKQCQAQRRVATGAMKTLLKDLRWVREASTTLRRMPDPYHQPEPWMNLLECEKEWSKALQQLDARCARPKKLEGARCMTGEQLMTNPQTFVCMMCLGNKRRCCNSAGALVSHQHRSHGYQNPFSVPRATRLLILVQKRWTTSGTVQSGAASAFQMVTYPFSLLSFPF